MVEDVVLYTNFNAIIMGSNYIELIGTHNLLTVALR